VVPDPAQALGPAQERSGLPRRGQGAITNQSALYKEAAAQLKVNVPKSDLRSSKFGDGVTWDGKDPAKYAASFKIKAA